MRTYYRDTELDGEFNSDELMGIFTVGKYENGQDTGWAEGNWNGDAAFGSGDRVFVLQDGADERGAHADISAVPERSSALLVLIEA